MTDTPTHPIDKELVAKRFSYSRSTYDREASVQRQVAEKMMRLLTDALLSAGIPLTTSADNSIIKAVTDRKSVV